MADKTGIEWTEASLNPIRARHSVTGSVGWHCTRVSEGCRNCYAENLNAFRGTGAAYVPYAPVEVFLDEKILAQASRWNRPRQVFMGSMTDLFASFIRPEWHDTIFAKMAETPRHTYQILTKRPGAMLDYLESRRARGLPVLGNVWLGTSAENQDCLDVRGQPMATIADQGWMTWCSAEPLLGPIDVTGAHWIRWLVVGGESGPRARPMLPRWVDSLRLQCGAYGIPFFFKQWGAFVPRALDSQAQTDLVTTIQLLDCDETGMRKVGKRKAGAMLHGRKWRAYPVTMGASA